MDQQQQSRWRPTRRQLLWAVGIVAVLTVAVLIGYRYGITLWDWIKLLIVPAVIAGGGIWFNAQQRDREQQIADQRAQDEAFQAYLDQMSGMLIPNDDQLSLYDEQPPDSLRTVARARTLTVLPRLTGDLKARVVQFLYESGLITRQRAVVDLTAADLRGTFLNKAPLSRADLSGADLSGANLFRANLTMARLSSSWQDVGVESEDVDDIDVTEAKRRVAALAGNTEIQTRLVGAVLSLAWLIGADLSGADLSGANLSEAYLSHANLFRANLSGADLRNAHLEDATVTEEQLAQAQSLDGATMPDEQVLKGPESPNGPTFTEWRKSIGREEDVDNN